MKKNVNGIFWGLVLILGGLVALAQSLGYIRHINADLVVLGFGALSAISLISYLVAGLKNWGMLFPAGIFAAVAFLVFMAQRGVDNTLIVAPIFVALGIPFVVAFLSDRTRNWWALIPAGFMFTLAANMALSFTFNGAWLIAIGLFAAALVFLFVFLSRRTQFWALLVAYIFACVGCLPLLSAIGRPQLIGAFFPFAIGLPFLAVYLFSPTRWWAVIPAGILITAGVAATLGISLDWAGWTDQAHLLNGMTLVGIAGTFAIVWQRHQKDFARILTILFLVFAGINFLFSGALGAYWPVLFIALGLGILFYNGIRTRTA